MWQKSKKKYCVYSFEKEQIIKRCPVTDNIGALLLVHCYYELLSEYHRFCKDPCFKIPLTTTLRLQIIGLHDIPGQTAATIAQRVKCNGSNDENISRPMMLLTCLGQEGFLSYLKGKVNLLHGQRIKIGFKQVLLLILKTLLQFE